MKKTIVYTISMVFVVALGAAYAADDNGVTDFTGRSYDTLEMAPVAALNSVEGKGAGGTRAGDKELFNGVTDFSGRSYDTLEIGTPAAAGNSVEGKGAGGLREEQEGNKASHESVGTSPSSDKIRRGSPRGKASPIPRVW